MIAAGIDAGDRAHCKGAGVIGLQPLETRGAGEVGADVAVNLRHGADLEVCQTLV